MVDTTIRLSQEAKRRLDGHKREGESYDDVVMRLTDRDKWSVFGIAHCAEDGREGMEQIREELNAGMERHVRTVGRRPATDET